MITGFAQFGAVEMGGMFTVVKVREDLARDDYKDPGWDKQGTVAYEWKGEAPAAPAASSNGAAGAGDAQYKAIKPRGGHSGN